MKFLYTLNSGSFGGMEKHVVDLCKGMIKNGHEVYVWCPPGDNVSNFKGAGAEVVLKKINLDIDPIYISKLSTFLRKEKIDVIHAHELKAVVNSLIAGRLAGTKVRISHTHTPISEWQINPAKKKLNLFVYPKIVNSLATYEIALTASRKDIKIREGIKEEKLKVLESANAVDLHRFTVGYSIKEAYKNKVLKEYDIREDAVVWGCLGRLTEEKGHSVLIRAFELFLEGLPSEEKNRQHLILAGGGHLQKLLSEQIAQASLEEQVTITGTLPHQEIVKHYSSFDYFVHPSLAEGFGLVLIEAMALKVPVIASDLEVFKEVGGDTILYFKQKNAEDLARSMRNLYDNQDQIEHLTAKARKRVEDRYSLKKFIESYHNFYLELMRN